MGKNSVYKINLKNKNKTHYKQENNYQRSICFYSLKNNCFQGFFFLLILFCFGVYEYFDSFFFLIYKIIGLSA